MTNSCCGGESKPPSYQLSLSTGCDDQATLWDDVNPPTGCEPCHYRIAVDCNGCWYTRTGVCGGWKKMFCPTDPVPVDGAEPVPIKVNVNGQDYVQDAQGCINLPNYPTGGGGVDTDTHATVSIAGTAYPEDGSGNIDLPPYPTIKVNGTPVIADAANCYDLQLTGGGVDTDTHVTVSIGGVDYPEDLNGNIDLPPYPVLGGDLCDLPVSDSYSPCCDDYVAMCRAVVDTNGDPTNEAESVLVPLAHINGTFEATDIDHGMENTCPGQTFYVKGDNGCYSLYLNGGLPAGSTDPLVFCIGLTN